MGSSPAAYDLHDLQPTAGVPDPEARLEALARAAGPLRRVVAAIAARLVACEGWKRLGYARPGDYARERLGCSARSFQDWARVDRSLAELPGLERELVEGTLAWSKVRLLARFVAPEDEAVWIAYARSQSVRELERAVRVANRGALEAGFARGDSTAESRSDREGCEEQRAWVRIPASFAVALEWQRFRTAAAQVAGQRLTKEAVLEMVTAEVLSALPLQRDVSETGPVLGSLPDLDPEGDEQGAGLSGVCESDPKRRSTMRPGTRGPHAGMSGASAMPERQRGWCELPRFLHPLVAGLEAAGGSSAHAVDAFELDARLRRAVRLEQRLEAELGPLLRQVAAPEYEWRAGVTSLAAFARERLGISPRKVRALLRVERVGDLCPALRAAYRDGRLSWLQAQLLTRLLAHETVGSWRERWVSFAQGVSVRRLEEAVEAALVLREVDSRGLWQDDPERCIERVATLPGGGAEAGAGAGGACDGTGDAGRQVCAPTGVGIDDPARGEREEHRARRSCQERCRITISAAADVARLFDATLSSVRLAIEQETGRLPSEGQAFEAMLDHAAQSWQLEDPWLRRRKPGAVRIFERDGWRCTVPGCSSRRNLQAHHIEFRSQGGSDEDSNQTTLCAFHHLRGVHGGVIAVRGRAPDGLVFDLGCRPGRPPLARYSSGDRRIDP